MKARRCLLWPKLTLWAVAGLLALAAAHGPASASDKCIARVTPAPSPAPGASGSSPASPGASAPASTPTEPPLYTMGDEIFTIDRDATAYYYFQGNRDGSAKAKYEVRYDHNLWDTCAQLQVRMPFITRYPTGPSSLSPYGRPYTGFGNFEIRYSYSVPTPKFDHALEFGVALPTQDNGVESTDTQLKAFYTTKWKWNGGSVSYLNEFDQTVIRPPGSSYTSYYEGKLTLPNYGFARGLKFSGFYNYRVLFDTGSLYKSAAGAIINGSFNDVAMSLVDSWGIGTNGLWKYKVEASLVARF